MKEVGTPGTLSGLMMRLGQCGFAAGSVAYMVTATGFSNFTAFWFVKVTLFNVFVDFLLRLAIAS